MKTKDEEVKSKARYHITQITRERYLGRKLGFLLNDDKFYYYLLFLALLVALAFLSIYCYLNVTIPFRNLFFRANDFKHEGSSIVLGWLSSIFRQITKDDNYFTGSAVADYSFWISVLIIPTLISFEVFIYYLYNKDFQIKKEEKTLLQEFSKAFSSFLSSISSISAEIILLVFEVGTQKITRIAVIYYLFLGVSSMGFAVLLALRSHESLDTVFMFELLFNSGMMAILVVFIAYAVGWIFYADILMSDYFARKKYPKHYLIELIDSAHESAKKEETWLHLNKRLAFVGELKRISSYFEISYVGDFLNVTAYEKAAYLALCKSVSRGFRELAFWSSYPIESTPKDVEKKLLMALYGVVLDDFSMLPRSELRYGEEINSWNSTVLQARSWAFRGLYIISPVIVVFIVNRLLFSDINPELQDYLELGAIILSTALAIFELDPKLGEKLNVVSQIMNIIPVKQDKK